MMEKAPRVCASGSIRAGRAARVAVCLAALALWLALALLMAGCDSDAEEQGQRAVTVEVMRVEPELLIDVAVYSGQLDAEHSVTVKPEIDGIVASIDFEQGQDVAAGDVLFTLRNQEQAARLREARANRNLARGRWNRAKQLVSRDASSLAARDVAQAELEIAEARVELARLQLDRTEIRAPFDGVVGRRFVDIGARIDQDTELARVDAIERLELNFGITDEGLSLARVGMKVQARVRAYPGQQFAGEVFFVSPTLDPRNRRIWVKAWIPNGDHLLRPGLFANVELELRRIENAIVVPESAVAVDRQGPFVWKVDAEQRATRLPIETGLRERGVVEVIQGLPPGTSIVSAGAHKVSEGSRVEVSEDPLVGRARHAPPEGSLIGEGT
jgi:membrane fusion protein (multidrug efflux system)